MKTEFRFDELTGFPKLFSALVHNFPATKGLFSNCGAGRESLIRCAHQRRVQSLPGESGVMDSLEAQNERFGAHPKALRNAKRIGKEEMLLVGSICNANLFGGPLEIFLKALTAARIADLLEENQIPAVPLLWVNSDATVGQSGILDLQNTPRQVEFGKTETAGGFETAFSLFQECLPKTDFAAQIYAEISRCYQASPNRLAAEAQLLARLLSPFGVVVFAPGLEGFESPTKQLEDEVRRERERLDGVRQERLRELLRMGFDDGSQNKFLHSRPPARGSVTTDLLPFRLLPWFTRVCSPGELAGHALLSPLLEALGIQDPVVLPACSMTVVEPRVGKVLDKFELELPDFLKSNGNIQDALSARFESMRLTGRFAAAEQKVGRQLDLLRGALGSDRSTLLAAIDAIEQRILYQVQNVKKKHQESWQRQQVIARQQIEKANNYLFPLGLRQEQFLNIHYFLIRHGVQFLEEIYRRLDARPTGHQVLYYSG